MNKKNLDMKVAFFISNRFDKNRGIGRHVWRLMITAKSLYPDIDFYITNNRDYADSIGFPYISYHENAFLYHDIQFVIFCQNGNDCPKSLFSPKFYKVSNLQKVSIIHDIIDVLLDEDNEEIALIPDKKNIKMKKFYQEIVDHSDIIFTVSEYSKDDILKHLNVPKNKPISVIYPAPLLDDLSEHNISNDINTPYFLYNGGFCFRKGVLQLVSNFIRLKSENKLKSILVITGSNNLQNKNIDILINYGVNRGYIIDKGFVPDAKLSYLYKNALAMVYPSLYEGFGIPLVEAMRVGCPIITCYSSSIKEVCGDDGAYYINKFDSDSFQKALILFESKDFVKQKEKLIQKGYENLKRFSWEESAHKFVKVLKENKKSYSKKFNILKETLKETNEVISRLQKFKAILDEKYDLNLTYEENTSCKKISIVIVTYNRAQCLEELLKSLYSLNYPDFEVVVVAGPCTDNTMEILYGYKHDIKIAKCPVVNISVAKNIGIAMSCGDYIAFIDDDAVPDPNWLNKLILGFKNDEVAGIGSGVYDKYGISCQEGKIYNNRFDQKKIPTVASYPYGFRFNSVLGTNCIFKKSCLLDIQGFDEQYEYYLEEVDLCARLIDYGYIVDYVEGAFVHHKEASSHIREGNKITNWFVYGKSTVYFIKNYENIAGKELINKVINKKKEEYEAKIMDMYKNEVYTKKEFLACMKDFNDGIKSGLRASNNGPLLITDKILSKYKSIYKIFNSSSLLPLYESSISNWR